MFILYGQDLLRSMPEEQKAQEANAARVERFLAAARPHWRCERKGMLQAGILFLTNLTQ